MLVLHILAMADKYRHFTTLFVRPPNEKSDKKRLREKPQSGPTLWRI